MPNHYEIDIGNSLYEALWDDPARPPEFSVTEWAQAVLTAWLVAGKIEREGGMNHVIALVSEPRA